MESALRVEKLGTVNVVVADKTPPRLPGWFPRLCTTPKSEAVFVVQKRWDHPGKRGGGSSVADVNVVETDLVSTAHFGGRSRWRIEPVQTASPING